ncbi:hypothetical protein MELB17_02180 [Marinobacter sp. ELB17]|nr:hypothetical protein MELB17_02180 [Marinobacter sp. ELB17]
MVSRPLRARGLKQPHAPAIAQPGQSRPLRARGLKLGLATYFTGLYFVAPPAGAWIETHDHVYVFAKIRVAPPAGAWIETALCTEPRQRKECRAPCGRVD